MILLEAFKTLPIEERKYIQKLESVIGPLPLMEEVINNYLEEGDTYPSFIRIKNTHIRRIRIKVSEGFRIEPEEVFDRIDQLEYLEEITISGNDYLWNEIIKIIQTKFPKIFRVVTYTDPITEHFEIYELGFFSFTVRNQSAMKYCPMMMVLEKDPRQIKYLRIK